MAHKTNGKPKPFFLFSIDLEDIRFRMKKGTAYKERVPENTYRYLAWLKKHGFTCTFFTVGDIARAYPSLIKDIVAEGHELACHTNTHKALDTMIKTSFKKDLHHNIESLLKAGAKTIRGFRAPYFSLTQKTAWAYDVMDELGLTYSSSVYPADNPFFGWKAHGHDFNKTPHGIIELPMTVNRFTVKEVAFAGGVYFRNLPFYVIKKRFKTYFKAEQPVLSYFHPYDIDVDQEQFMHPEINNSHFYNFLMRNNRKNVFKRLDALKAETDYTIIPYQRYVENHLL
ncbi:polysaccharide deacetylase family protein [Marixanthomonas spongiae]|uniref:NodB homology domain-containing protein n=1 Tax=Marixanthomonas spongiae TaxID=2174845 RepID=A0A2U0I5Y4_9FLAO|nr:polysaccharide deacetylase family protein [Marixanthomonas spongiae]PVW16474.1 hypothetical protein DDV96_04255 [Marixanthomonas spongiae]